MTDTRHNSSFSVEVPGLQLGVDSTSLGAFKRCPRYYQLAIVEGWQPRESSVHLQFGIWMHEAREGYEHAKVAGASHDEAVDKVVEYLLEVTWNRALGRPWISGHPSKNRLSLIRTAVWYLDTLARDDPFETVVLANGKPAVELSFRYDSGYKTDSSGESWVLCGHLDRLARHNDSYYIPDIKTTVGSLGPHFFASFSPSTQFSLYTHASKVIFSMDVRSLVVDGIQVGATFARFQRSVVPRPPSVIAEWHSELQIWLRQMEDCALAQHWPQNDAACGLYGGCQFRGVCSAATSQRDGLLAADFVKRVWDPLVARGDI